MRNLGHNLRKYKFLYLLMVPGMLFYILDYFGDDGAVLRGRVLELLVWSAALSQRLRALSGDALFADDHRQRQQSHRRHDGESNCKAANGGVAYGHPYSGDHDSLEVLKPHINEDHWKEVIPLVAVLLVRKAKPLIEYLMELCKTDESLNDYDLTTKKIILR